MKCLTLLLMMALSAVAGLEVGTFNIRNFDRSPNSTDKNLLQKMILEMNPDLLAVQEIYNDSSFKRFVRERLSGYGAILSECGGSGRQKLGFIYKKQSLEMLSHWEDGRLESALAASCGSLRPALGAIFKNKEDGTVFAAMSVHLKAGSGSRNHSRRAKQYNLLAQIVEELQAPGQGNVLVMGDFNTTGYDLRNSDYRAFRSFLGKASAQTSAESAQCTSYWAGRDYRDGIEEASTLDHVVYAGDYFHRNFAGALAGGHCLKAACRDVPEEVLGASYQSVSDHCPVAVSFR